MYAQLCKRLSEEAPNFEPPDSPCTFKVLLLSKCKAEFENRTATNDYFERYGGKLSPEDEEKKHLAKRKMLGNIKFIGELGKLDILAEGILHRCILQLLHPFKKRRAPAPSSSAITPSNASTQSGAQDSEDLECLAQLVRTCGRILDSDKGHNLMDQYFERMETLAQMPELPPRIRFMLRDVIELRRDNWVPRKATSTEGPMPIQQLRGDEDIRGGYMSRGREQRSTERESDWMMGGLRGINDMLSGLNVSSPSTNLIPTHHDKYNFSPNGFGNNRDHRSANEGAFRGHNNQRGNQGGNNYNNYNNRGYNKHNQHNNNTHNNSNYNSNNSSNKDLAPRFKKNLSMLVQGPEEVQMRPPANSLLFKANNIKANPPMPFNPVPRAHTGNDAPITMIVPTSVKVPPLAPASVLHKEAPVLIKQASVDKPKQIKKDKGPNKEELIKKVSFLLSVEGENTTETVLDVVVNAYKELKVPDKFAKDVVLTVFNDTLEKNDPARELSIKLLFVLRKESLLPIQAPLDGLRALCASMSARETATPRIASLVGGLIAHAVIGGLVTLVDVASLTENGQHYPLFLLVLQQMLKTMGKQELVDIYNASKVNLMAVLPECDRTKDRLAEILEDRALSFLCPLLRVQAELWKQLQADTNPQKFYKWIKDNLDVSCHTDPGFINALMTVLLKYITQETTLSDGSIPSVLPSKPLLDKEKALLERFRVVFKAFLNGRTDLQLTALYSLQVYCFSLNFPKGMLLRWFMSLYEFEIIEEDVFLNWKEDLTDAYPGKGKGLFQVNNWLTWLQETPSTDEEENIYQETRQRLDAKFNGPQFDGPHSPSLGELTPEVQESDDISSDDDEEDEDDAEASDEASTSESDDD